jgi:hypothetical protein
MTRSQRFLGLNAARILASFHIVVGHLYQVRVRLRVRLI